MVFLWKGLLDVCEQAVSYICGKLSDKLARTQRFNLFRSDRIICEFISFIYT